MSVEFNQDRVEIIRPIVMYIAGTLLVVSVFLDVATFKWRQLADLILYFETISTFVAYAIPSVNANYTEFILAASHVLLFIVISTDTRGQIVFTSCSHILATFVLMTLIYKHELTLY